MNPKQRPPLVLTRRTLMGNAARLAPFALGGGTVLSTLAAPGKPGRDLSSDALLQLSAREVIEHIRNGDLKAEAYMARLLTQFHAHEDLKAVITIDASRIMEEARAVDAARARGAKLGPAAGLPFGVKDQIDAAGYVTTGGNGNLKANLRKDSAPAVAALTQAGAIVFAKTNMPDMVAGYDWAVAEASQNPYFGTPRNPYDPTHLVGGTSGGNAVAIASRFIPAAIGEDTTGSIRFPAACCGIAGLRPSTYTIDNALHDTNHKRYSDAGIVVPPAGAQDTWGPMARTVADVAFLDALITGESAVTTDLRQVRIAIPNAAYWEKDFVDPGLAQVCLAAFAQLRHAGAQLVEIDFDAVRDLSENLEFGNALKRPERRDLKQWLAQNAPGVTIEQIYARRADQQHPPGAEPPLPKMTPEVRKRILTTTAQRYAAVYESNRVSAIAFPTVPIPAPRLQNGPEVMHTQIEIRGKQIDQTLDLARNIFWGPRLGGPGLNIPAGLTRGLPVGIELTGLPGKDREILGLGLAVERVWGPIAPPPFITI